jgi:hypothetical protein
MDHQTYDRLVKHDWNVRVVLQLNWQLIAVAQDQRREHDDEIDLKREVADLTASRIKSDGDRDEKDAEHDARLWSHCRQGCGVNQPRMECQTIDDAKFFISGKQNEGGQKEYCGNDERAVKRADFPGFIKVGVMTCNDQKESLGE